ncbi:uncharacterized protein LOC122226320 [Panthera leo]|uniref:uncharacterized protein LOC122226320 n=1 Tax=Panthera leo TaxID=9689 RepID=UPI001C6A4417|nr:uncharacterized protein LOC122226320 [Panthera leo]
MPEAHMQRREMAWPCHDPPSRCAVGQLGRERPELQGSEEVGSRKAETSGGLVRLSAVPQTGAADHGDFSVPSDSPNAEKEELSRELREENQRIANLIGQRTHLQAEEVSLHVENAQLESEIQQLQVRLQIQRETCKEHVLQLEGKRAEQETSCGDGEKQLPKACGSLDATCGTRSLHKKMAEDLGRKSQRTTSSYKEAVLLSKGRGRKSGRAPLSVEREPQELRREDYHLRQRLVHSGPKVQPVPWGPHAPAALPAASRACEGPGAPLYPRCPRRGRGTLAGLRGWGLPTGLTQLSSSQALDAHEQGGHNSSCASPPSHGHCFLSLG